MLGGIPLDDIPFCIGSERPFRRIENDESILPRVLDHGAQTDSNLMALQPRRFEGFRNFIPKHSFTRYCWLTIDGLVEATTIRRRRRCEPSRHTLTLCDALVASEKRLGP